MPSALKTHAALALATGLLSPASAAGFIGMTQPFAQPHGCGGGTRVWVDMNSPIGSATYASAMMAYAMKLPVTIRAFEDSGKVFGECQLYDIFY